VLIDFKCFIDSNLREILWDFTYLGSNLINQLRARPVAAAIPDRNQIAQITRSYKIPAQTSKLQDSLSIRSVTMGHPIGHQLDEHPT
jgi:hypothetical protein